MISLFSSTVHVAAFQRRCSCLFPPCCLFPFVYKAHYLAAACWMPALSPTELLRLGHSGRFGPYFCCPVLRVKWFYVTYCFTCSQRAFIFSEYRVFFFRGKGNRCLGVVHPQHTRPYLSSKGTSGTIFASGSSLTSWNSTDIHPNSHTTVYVIKISVVL